MLTTCLVLLSLRIVRELSKDLICGNRWKSTVFQAVYQSLSRAHSMCSLLCSVANNKMITDKRTCQICNVYMFKPFQSHETFDLVCTYNEVKCSLFQSIFQAGSILLNFRQTFYFRIVCHIMKLLILTHLFAFVHLVAILL